jgi:hypothetical protein
MFRNILICQNYLEVTLLYSELAIRIIYGCFSCRLIVETGALVSIF